MKEVQEYIEELKELIQLEVGGAFIEAMLESGVDEKKVEEVMEIAVFKISDKKEEG